MKHFLLIKSAGHSASGTPLSAQDSALALLKFGMWLLWSHTRNRKAIAAGDSVAIHRSGIGASKVIATAMVSVIVPWTAAMAKSYPLVLDGVPYSMLRLSDILLLEQAIAVIFERLRSGGGRAPIVGVGADTYLFLTDRYRLADLDRCERAFRYRGAMKTNTRMQD